MEVGMGRKRERSNADEDEEFMPLSKRITFLNLNPQGDSPSYPTTTTHSQQYGGRGNIHSTHLSPPGSQPTSNNCSQERWSGDMLSGIRYEPSLNEVSNPYYYQQNRHLFDLYLQRISRNNLPPHPNLQLHSSAPG